MLCTRSGGPYSAHTTNELTYQVLGWPCGASLRIGSATFHKWQLPVQAAELA